MYRLIFSTTDPRQAAKLEKLGLRMPGVELEHNGELYTGYSKPAIRERAAAVYRDYSDGLSGQEVALRHGISIQTVSRIVLDPKRYGIQAKPIRRTKKRRK